MTKDILPFPLSTCPTAAETSLSLEVGRAQLGQAEEEEAMVKQLLGHGQHLSVFTLCWIHALSTVLCHGQFICGVAPARLFACEEIKTEGLIARTMTCVFRATWRDRSS